MMLTVCRKKAVQGSKVTTDKYCSLYKSNSIIPVIPHSVKRIYNQMKTRSLLYDLSGFIQPGTLKLEPLNLKWIDPRHSAPLARSLLSKFLENLILATQNVVSHQHFHAFGIPFTHKFQHLNMVFIADFRKLAIF